MDEAYRIASAVVDRLSAEYDEAVLADKAASTREAAVARVTAAARVLGAQIVLTELARARALAPKVVTS